MKAILLLSGGIDSPVAGRMLQDQGVEVEALHCSFEPVTDAASVDKALELGARLGLEHIHVARMGSALAEIARDKEAHRYYFVLQKRIFYQLADRLATELEADVIVTGENLGQVSSQTLQNLVSIEAVAEHPVVRPLLGLDKVEIIDAARGYDTYETSIGPELCDLLGPDRPATVSNAEAVAEHEARVGIDVSAIDIEAMPVPPMATTTGA